MAISWFLLAGIAVVGVAAVIVFAVVVFALMRPGDQKSKSSK